MKIEKGKKKRFRERDSGKRVGEALEQPMSAFPRTKEAVPKFSAAVLRCEKARLVAWRARSDVRHWDRGFAWAVGRGGWKRNSQYSSVRNADGFS